MFFDNLQLWVVVGNEILLGEEVSSYEKDPLVSTIKQALKGNQQCMAPFGVLDNGQSCCQLYGEQVVP